MPTDFPIMYTREMLNRQIISCRAAIVLREEQLKTINNPVMRELVENEIRGYKVDLQKLERAKSPHV